MRDDEARACSLYIESTLWYISKIAISPPRLGEVSDALAVEIDACTAELLRLIDEMTPVRTVTSVVDGVVASIVLID